ncbi:hypothetical protein E2493_04265 [Sphingomonas parva]|uniref:CBM-cenC domain-containing protein n=1 Tax=Sphingomonas parva TaxID=2555898 RepID=A0A4Y8ZTQ1_9SPHN|nr:hypothetical protein [Sphingomonas parva]TFI59418.1 hypothetical protein E2493_04265 [Sphingomonas parva]
MKGRAFAFCLLLATPLAATAVLAQDAETDALLKQIINVPSPKAFSVQGMKPAPKVRKDGTVQGGEALRISVPGKGANAWDIAVSDPIQKPVKAGDRLVLAFWARLEKGADGATTATLPYNGIQLSSPPYSALLSAPVEIGPEWKMHEIRGVADKDYAAGALGVTIHLATAKQVVDIGPIFVLDQGPKP